MFTAYICGVRLFLSANTLPSCGCGSPRAFCYATFLTQIYFAFLPPGEDRTRALVGRGTGSRGHPLRSPPHYRDDSSAPARRSRGTLRSRLSLNGCIDKRMQSGAMDSVRIQIRAAEFSAMMTKISE